jgi:hypothetical protein
VKIRNQTGLPTERLREIIRFCCPSGVTDFLITFKHWNAYCGCAQAKQWSEYSTDKDKRLGRAYWSDTGTEVSDVIIKIRKNAKGSGKIEERAWKKGAYLPSDKYTQEEAIVHLVAHELRHLWQAKVKKGRRVWGARGRYSERDCDAYAIGVVRHWRRAGSPFFGSAGEVVPAPKRVEIPSVIRPPAQSNAVLEPPIEPVFTWNAVQWLFSEDFGLSRRPKRKRMEAAHG